MAEPMVKEHSLSWRGVKLGQLALLRSHREKVAQEMVALRAQIAQGEESLKFQKPEREINRRLLKDGTTLIAQLEGTVADYGVKFEERRGELARPEQRAADTDLRVRSLESDYRQQANDRLKVTPARLSEIEQEQRKPTDTSSCQVIAAPTTGEIIRLKYTTPGAVIPPRDTVAEIVPAEAPLVIEARIRTEDVSRIAPGNSARVWFTAFKYRSTPLVSATVTYFAGDRMVDRNLD